MTALSQSPVGIASQLPLVGHRMAEMLTGGVTVGTFGGVYEHILAVPGKRVRAGLVLASAQLSTGIDAVSVPDAVDVACAIEMLHESSLVHDDICDGSLLRRDSPSVAAAFGVRTAARAGFHLAGTALRILADVISHNPEAFGRTGRGSQVMYLDQLSNLSFGQLIETIPPATDDAALRRHYRLVAAAKTGTLFRLACSYGGTAGAVGADGLANLMSYADELALAFQIMDDVRDIEGGSTLGKDACGDLDRRVPTWPVIEWLARWPEARFLWLEKATSSTDLQSELVRTGATVDARAVAVECAQTAHALLDEFDPSPGREHLRDLATAVVTR